jgi:hypothetical protein
LGAISLLSSAVPSPFARSTDTFRPKSHGKMQTPIFLNLPAMPRELCPISSSISCRIPSTTTATDIQTTTETERHRRRSELHTDPCRRKVLREMVATDTTRAPATGTRTESGSTRRTNIQVTTTSTSRRPDLTAEFLQRNEAATAISSTRTTTAKR